MDGVDRLRVEGAVDSHWYLIHVVCKCLGLVLAGGRESGKIIVSLH